VLFAVERKVECGFLKAQRSEVPLLAWLAYISSVSRDLPYHPLIHSFIVGMHVVCACAFVGERKGCSKYIAGTCMRLRVHVSPYMRVFLVCVSVLLSALLACVFACLLSVKGKVFKHPVRHWHLYACIYTPVRVFLARVRACSFVGERKGISSTSLALLCVYNTRTVSAMTGHLWTDPLMYLSYAEYLLAWDKGGTILFTVPAWADLDLLVGRRAFFRNVRSVLSGGTRGLTCWWPNLLSFNYELGDPLWDGASFRMPLPFVVPFEGRESSSCGLGERA
jgi:hypothetical protein